MTHHNHHHQQYHHHIPRSLAFPCCCRRRCLLLNTHCCPVTWPLLACLPALLLLIIRGSPFPPCPLPAFCMSPRPLCSSFGMHQAGRAPFKQPARTCTHSPRSRFRHPFSPAPPASPSLSVSYCYCCCCFIYDPRVTSPPSLSPSLHRQAPRTLARMHAPPSLTTNPALPPSLPPCTVHCCCRLPLCMSYSCVTLPRCLSMMVGPSFQCTLTLLLPWWW